MNEGVLDEGVVDVETSSLAELVHGVVKVVDLPVEEASEVFGQNRVVHVLAECVDCVHHNMPEQVECSAVEVFFDDALLRKVGGSERDVQLLDLGVEVALVSGKQVQSRQKANIALLESD